MNREQGTGKRDGLSAQVVVSQWTLANSRQCFPLERFLASRDCPRASRLLVMSWNDRHRHLRWLVCRLEGFVRVVESLVAGHFVAIIGNDSVAVGSCWPSKMLPCQPGQILSCPCLIVSLSCSSAMSSLWEAMALRFAPAVVASY